MATSTPAASPNSVVDALAALCVTDSKPDAAARKLFSAREEPLRLVVLGGTGVGKSTLLNRMTQSLDKKRSVELFAEGEGITSITRDPIEKPAFFLGNEAESILLVDMPGLDDSEGADADSEHLQNVAKYLMALPNPTAHLFVLVVNSQQPDLSASVCDMMTSFAKLFDSDGTKRFVDYLAVAFTKMDFQKLMFDDGDIFDDPLTKEHFDVALDAKKEELVKGWPVKLAAILGHGGDTDAIRGLQSRCVYIDSTLPPQMMTTLHNDFGHDLQFEMGNLFLWAMNRQRHPFPLDDLESVVSKQAQLAQAAEQAAQEAKAVEAKIKAEAQKQKKEREAQERKLQAEREERIRQQAAIRAAQEQQARLQREKAQREAEQQRVEIARRAKLQREEAERRAKLQREEAERAQRQREEARRQQQEQERREREAYAQREYEEQLRQRQREEAQQQARYEQQLYEQQLRRQQYEQQQRHQYQQQQRRHTYRSNGSANGREVHSGSRGGQYYFTASGNKRYI